jgi:hypothetical protein
VLKISTDYPADTLLIPDKILVDQKPYSGEVMPGTREIEVHKTGYKAIKEQFFIDVDSTPQVFARFMQVMLRSLRLSFTDSATKQAVSVPRVEMDGHGFGIAEAIQIKPGKHTILVTADEYEKHIERVEVAPGDTPVDIRIELKKSAPVIKKPETPVKPEVARPEDKEKKVEGKECVVDIETATRFPGPGSKKIRPDAVFLNDQKIKSGQSFASGKYRLTIKLAGYTTIEKDITIPDTGERFTIKEELVPSPRKLIFRITVDYPVGATIVPDKVLIDKKEFSGDVEPGAREIEIYKAGYQPIKDQFFVDVDSVPHTFLTFMRVVARPIKLIFVDSNTGKEVTPKRTEIDGREVDISKNIQIMPGEHMIQVFSDDYRKYLDTLSIAPGDTALELKIKLSK